MSRRVTFLIDGFNLYHSLDDAQDIDGSGVKWLDLRAMCRALLINIEPSGQLHEVYYFTAPADHRGQHAHARQRIYLQALEDSGVFIIQGRFKSKNITCRHCDKSWRSQEEKKTDVAIAVKALELCQKGAVDTLVFVTGDTDQIPPLEYIRNEYPDVTRTVAVPRKRSNRDLLNYVDNDVTMSSDNYAANQFPNTITLSSGK